MPSCASNIQQATDINAEQLPRSCDNIRSSLADFLNQADLGLSPNAYRCFFSDGLVDANNIDIRAVCTRMKTISDVKPLIACLQNARVNVPADGDLNLLVDRMNAFTGNLFGPAFKQANNYCPDCLTKLKV